MKKEYRYERAPDYEPKCTINVSNPSAKDAWQESRKQAIAECKMMDRHTKETIEEAAVLRENKRCVDLLLKHDVRIWAELIEIG